MSLVKKLRREITDDPLSKYARLGDKEILAAINAKNRTVDRIEPASKFSAIALRRGLLVELKTAAADKTSPAREAAEVMRAIVYGEINEVDYTRPTIRVRMAAILSDLLGAGIITKQQSDEFGALGVEVISRAEELGLGALDELTIRRARRWR